MPFARSILIPVLLVAGVLLALAGPADSVPPAPTASARTLLDSAGAQLIAMRVDGPGGGWAWPSGLQRRHLQTDRDVGAAGVLVGLLAAWRTTGDRRYLDGARRAGDWLLATAQRAPGGLRWPDYHDHTKVDDTHFTSFDDGAAGIADALWRLGRTSHDPRYTRAALAGIRWVAAQAVGVRGTPCPRLCRWHYYDDAEDYETGMGEGQAGIAWALDAFAKRTGSPRLRAQADGAGRYLASLMSPAGAMPERPGDHEHNTGFLSGAAGQAFLFLQLYRHTGERRWLHAGRRALGWVRSVAVHPTAGGLAWPIAVNPDNGGDGHKATGFEEGAAGIGWTELQAWRVTHDPRDLRTARAAGDWLVSRAFDPAREGWPEDAGHRLTHTSLNNGAPGIGWFLFDLAEATGDPRYRAGAEAARLWLAGTAQAGAAGAYWSENRGRREWSTPRDSSWHWGSAGIVGFLARMAGDRVDAPGMEPGFSG